MARTRVLVLVLLAALAVHARPAFAQDTDEVDISGVYRCEGVNPSGKTYRGMVEIVKMHDTFQLRWTFPQGTDSALGIGIVTHGVLAVSYYGGDTAGVVVYKITAGKPLVGSWTVVGSDGGVFSETLTRLPGHGGPADDDAKPEHGPLGDPSTATQA